MSSNTDASRAPQLSATVPGQGTYQGGQDMGAGGDSNGDGDGDSDGSFATEFETMVRGRYRDEDNVSDDGMDPVGQEGVEGNQLATSGCRTPGCPCSCHKVASTICRRRLNYSPPSYSGMHSPTSTAMAVRGDSGESSVEDSIVWSTPSPVPSERNYMVNSMRIPESAFQSTYGLRFSLVHHPLALNPESIFPEGLFYYPMTLDIPEESEYNEGMSSLGLPTPPL